MSKIPSIAIIGSGWGTHVQLSAFRQAGWQIGGIWGRTPEKAEQLAREHSVPIWSHDYRDLLLYPQIDLISICTPPHLHREMAITALQAGKHVLCEKPAALNAGQVMEMLVVARSYPDQLALIDHELRFLPTRRKMRQILQSGVLGEIYHLRAIYHAGYGLYNSRAFNWWATTNAGGGILGAMGSHEIDQISWLLGMRIVRVQAHLATHVTQLPDESNIMHAVSSDDLAHLLLTFQNGVTANLELSIVQAGTARHSLTVMGSKGSLHYEDGRLLHYGAHTDQANDLSEIEAISAPAHLPANDWWRGSVYQAYALKEYLRTPSAETLAGCATFEDGLFVQQVLDAARLSAQLGKAVELGSDLLP